MTSPMPEPTRSPKIPFPGQGEPFTIDLSKAPSVLNSGSSPTDSTKSVWYTRPVPLTMAPHGQVTNPAMADPNSAAYNTYYSKTDVKSNWALLDPTLQALYTATARSFDKRSTGKGLFESLTDQSVYQSSIGNRINPHTLLYQVASQRGILKADGTFDASKYLTDSSGKSYGTQTATSVQKSVTLTDPDTARSILNSALETYLGQSASAEEEEKFLQALMKRERKNARVTTQQSTTTTSPGGSVSSIESMTQGGSNAQQFAVDWAKSQEGSAEFLAATDYLDEFMNALKDSADVVR
jgi:hypothetical protein